MKSSWLSVDTFTKLINRSSDVILALFVVTIIVMIIVPVSHFILDGFIAINFAISLGLLMVGLYISKAVHLSIFPSILLLTTLFRLGVEIAATRQILLYADAGQVIGAFGSLVVGGNFVVGAVIFLIITIVQFIVVTKGAERVAEVAARFTLDAMPGKQMSIDADMRSGIIDSNQARELRLALTKESQLYGAMDGAMKFVKGDVIAGIVIAIINIIGGIIVGTLFHNMTALESLKTFTLLSIGAGLVSQIPSLLISLTAGIVTTRVSSEKQDGNLGKDISEQLFAYPKGLILSSLFLFALGWIPGFPTLIFIILSLLIGGGAVFKVYRARKNRGGTGLFGSTDLAGETEDHSVVRGSSDEYSLTVPVILELSNSLSQLIRTDKTSGKFVEEMIPRMRHALYLDLGIRFPGVHMRFDSPTLQEDEYAILLNEVPIIRGKIIKDSVLTNESKETLKRYNLTYTESKNIIGNASLWVNNQYTEILKKAGIKFWTPVEVIMLHLSYFYKTHAADFIGIQEMRAILEFVEKSYPDLAKEVTRLIPLQKLTEIFKRLVQEEISIKDLRAILEALSEWAQTERDTVLLTEYVRSSLKRYISYKYSQGQSVLAAYLLDPEIEDMVRSSIKQTSAGSFLALDPDTSQLVIQAFKSIIVPVPAGSQPAVLITNMDVRRFVRKLIESDFPEMPVISYQEIIPEIRIQPLGRVQLT
ncbi:MAG: type III secretion system export apparatus subunit SctV [Chlamydiales bacterium]